MDGRSRDRWIAMASVAVLLLSGWLFWVLPRQWSGTPVQVDTDYVAPVP